MNNPFSEPKMSEVEEEISPFLSNLSLSRQAVSLVDPFRDDPSSEDDNDPDTELSDTSEEGFIIHAYIHTYIPNFHMFRCHYEDAVYLY